MLSTAVCVEEHRLNSYYDTLLKKLLRMLKRSGLSSRLLRLKNDLSSWLGKFGSDKCFTLLLFCYRFPFIACEIFTCEVDIILKTLVEDEEVRNLTLEAFFTSNIFDKAFIADCIASWQLMNLLFSFLDPKPSHSNLLAGYFSKVLIFWHLKFHY